MLTLVAITLLATRCTGLDNGIANGVVSKDDVDRHDSNATFSCNDGFELRGSSEINCDARERNESWPKAPTCHGAYVVEVVLNAAIHYDAD